MPPSSIRSVDDTDDSVGIEPTVAALPCSRHTLVNRTPDRLSFWATTNNELIELHPAKGVAPADGSVEVAVQFVKGYRRRSASLKPYKREWLTIHFAPFTEKDAKMSPKHELRLPVIIPPLEESDHHRELDLEITPIVATLPFSEHQVVNRSESRIVFRVSTSSKFVELRPFYGFIQPHARISVFVRYSKQYNRKPQPLQKKNQRFKIYYSPLPEGTDPNEIAKNVFARVRSYKMFKFYASVPRQHEAKCSEKPVIPCPEHRDEIDEDKYIQTIEEGSYTINTSPRCTEQTMSCTQLDDTPNEHSERGEPRPPVTAPVAAVAEAAPVDKKRCALL